ncbi:MAG: hypothetical protein AAFV53_13095 [Myxococcota bacterium]
MGESPSKWRARPIQERVKILEAEAQANQAEVGATNDKEVAICPRHGEPVNQENGVCEKCRQLIYRSACASREPRLGTYSAQAILEVDLTKITNWTHYDRIVAFRQILEARQDHGHVENFAQSVTQPVTEPDNDCDEPPAAPPEAPPADPVVDDASAIDAADVDCDQAPSLEQIRAELEERLGAVELLLEWSDEEELVNLTQSILHSAADHLDIPLPVLQALESAIREAGAPVLLRWLRERAGVEVSNG